MRIFDLITEAVSSVVYHYTNLDAAARILTSGEFALSSTLGSIEEKFAPKGYPYFLSTTRTRRGGYHSNAIGDGAAMFNLDGNYYNQRYKGGPIDYWGDRHNDYGRTAEAEDRIFSKEPTMPAGGITSVHIFVKPLLVAAVPGSSVDIRARESISSFAARARTALLAAKKAIGDIESGEVMEILSSDEGTKHDIPKWCEKMEHEFLGVVEEDSYSRLFLKKA